VTKPLKPAGWLNPIRRRPVGTVPDSVEAIRLREIQALAPGALRDSIIADAVTMTAAVTAAFLAHSTPLAGTRHPDALDEPGVSSRP